MEEINEADLVIFAADITVQKRERFEKLRIVEVTVQEAIKNTAAILSRLPG
jgi:fructose-specific phosphotransferase system component IIB